MGMEDKEILAEGLEGIKMCDHMPTTDIEYVRDQTTKILYAYKSNDEHAYGPEHDLIVLVELSDGRYAVVIESEDSSGHGCQCSGDISFFKNLYDAYNLGLTDEHRDKFIQSMPIK